MQETQADVGSVPGSGRSPGGGNRNPVQCSCLENSMCRGAWQATDHEIAKSWTWLSTHTHTHTEHTHTHTHTHTHSHTDRHTTQAPDSQAFKSSCLSPLSLCLVKWMPSQWTEVRPIPWSSSLLKVSSAPCRSGVSTVLRREETLPHQPQEGLFIGQGKPKLDSRFTHLKMELVKLRINKYWYSWSSHNKKVSHVNPYY